MAILDKIKLSGVTYDIIDATAVHSLDGYWNSGQTESAITAATSALAETIGNMHYQTSGDVQNAISGKADTSAVTESINEAVSGKLDTSIFNTYSGSVDTALGTKFAGASWNSTDKKIYFYDNASATGTALAYIDGTDFVKDGFLSSVTIDNRTISGESVPCLVFIWNTDSGIQETDIPLSGIFDPTNYVDVTTFNTYSGSVETALSGKADTTAVTESINEAVSGKLDTSTFNTYSGSVDTALSGKQETLVNQVNIKSINGASILGSGDLTVDTGLHASVSGTTLIFQ